MVPSTLDMEPSTLDKKIDSLIIERWSNKLIVNTQF